MVFTSHVVIGGAVGSLTQSPGLAFAGGFVSHHVADMFPHLDPGSFWEGKYWKQPVPMLVIGIDVVVGLGLLWFLWQLSGFMPTVIWGGIGGVMPDIIDHNPWQDTTRKWPVLKQYHTFHTKFHWTVGPKQWLLGSITQLALIIISFAIILIRY